MAASSFSFTSFVCTERSNVREDSANKLESNSSKAASKVSSSSNPFKPTVRDAK